MSNTTNNPNDKINAQEQKLSRRVQKLIDISTFLTAATIVIPGIFIIPLIGCKADECGTGIIAIPILLFSAVVIMPIVLVLSTISLVGFKKLQNKPKPQKILNIIILTISGLATIWGVYMFFKYSLYSLFFQ